MKFWLKISIIAILIIVIIGGYAYYKQISELSIIDPCFGYGEVGEFEDSINKKSGFVNAMMSATAFGKDAEYKRLLELEKQINRRLSIEDLTSAMELKSSVIANIKEMHTEYYSDDEMKAKTVIEKVMKDFNALSHTERNQIGFNHSAELIYSPFSYLRF